MPTVWDVADKAGVSVATVSRVINGTTPVSDVLRQRVIQAMEELGYRYNRVARSLRRGATHTLGLIIPNIADPFFAEMARSVEDAGRQKGYHVIFCSSDRDIERELAYANLLAERQVDGLLLVPGDLSKEHIGVLETQTVPLVVVDRDIPGAAVDSILVDNVQGGRLSTQHLLKQGHRRIACLTTPLRLGPFEKRLEGYRQALLESGILPDEALVIRAPFGTGVEARGYNAACAALDLAQAPTAIFACNDMMAIGALQAAIDRGLRVPENLSIIGFDDIPLASLAQPRLTTVAQPIAQMGELATQMLIERIEDSDLPPRRVLLDVSLQVRASTGRPRETK